MTENPVVDSHCHIASLDIIPPSFVAGLVENARLSFQAQGLRISPERIESMYLTRFDDPDCDELVAEMDAAGIDHAVLLAADFSYAMPDCRLTVEEALLRHAEVLARHPGRFSVFAGIDHRWGRDGLDLFERSIRDMGFHGLKLYPPCGFSPSDPALYPFYEIAAAWRIPVLAHIGGTCPQLAFDTATPVLLDQAARDFPGVDFILAHGSVSYVEECAMLAGFRPNVYIDVSGFQTAKLDQLRQLFGRNFMHKVLFGSDWPFFRLQGDQKDCLNMILQEGGPIEELRPHEERAFLGETVLRLLAKRRDVAGAGALRSARAGG
jgi:predicted TIM-barrel fold metal-dependent hydrolase